MMVMVDDIELYMKGKTMEGDIRIETAVGILQEDMTIHKGIGIGKDIMNDHLDGIEDSYHNITIVNGLDIGNPNCMAPLVIDQYLLNEFANPLEIEIEQLLLGHRHDTPALRVHNQRRYNSLMEQNPLRMPQNHQRN
jgi:hypothetical protein